MNKFIFDSFHYDASSSKAVFNYSFENGLSFQETVQFEPVKDCDETLLERALFLSFMLVGISYYKCFPGAEVIVKPCGMDAWQAKFFSTVYQEGIGQFAYENKLTRSDLAQFQATVPQRSGPLSYDGRGIVALQSGGKDSLLLATILENKNITYTPWYMRYRNESYPVLLEKLASKPRFITRYLDLDGLKKATSQGGRNGHVPVTYIVASFALIDAILHGDNTILLAIGHEGEEPTSYIGDLPVNHQWAKTWHAEQIMSQYVTNYISPDIRIGSPLRGLSELKIAELFARDAWQKYGHEFSSCNLANYKQANNNQKLNWCGECPKCANSFLLFAPFVEPAELKSIFNHQDLFAKPSLVETYKGLLGVDGVEKPFECVGEIAELRLAYHMTRQKWGSDYAELPFAVPNSNFDYQKTHHGQIWAKNIIN